MTVVEELVQIARTLGPGEQRRLLQMAIQLRQDSTPDLTEVPSAEASVGDWSTWRERLAEQQEAALSTEKARLVALGLVDDAWNARTEALPNDMIPSSDSSVET
jgi:hypothetical protein